MAFSNQGENGRNGRKSVLTGFLSLREALSITSQLRPLIRQWEWVLQKSHYWPRRPLGRAHGKAIIEWVRAISRPLDHHRPVLIPPHKLSPLPGTLSKPLQTLTTCKPETLKSALWVSLPQPVSCVCLHYFGKVFFVSKYI